MAYPIEFNVAKGRINELARLGLTNDALIAVVLESSGLVAEATMKDYDTLDAILAGASSEHTDFAREVLTGVTVTVNDTDDRQELDVDDIAYTGITGSTQSGLIVICYDGDTTGGTDANLIPLVADEFVFTPPGDVTYEVNAAGLFRAN